MLNDMHIATCDNRRILVIDDNLTIHEDFRKILTGATDSTNLDQAGASLFDEAPVPAYGKSFEVSFADQGQTGFHMVEQGVAEKTPYALAFVDMRMPPGWDGLQTIEQIWKTDSSIQVVICTAFSDRPWHEIAARVGRTDRLLILRKPFDALEVEQLAVSLTYKWELAKRAEMRMDGINALIDLRYKELLQSNARLKEEIATRTAEVSNHNDQFQQLNEQFQQFVKDLRRAINTADSAN
jgi:two-component system, NtrC family, sensor kinase